MERLVVLQGRRGVDAELLEADQVIAQGVFAGDRVGDAGGAREAVGPEQPGAAEDLPAVAAELLHDVRLAAAEAAELGVEADPGFFEAGEEAHPLLPDREGVGVGGVGAFVGGPDSPRAAAPAGVLVRGGDAAGVGHEGAGQEIAGVRVRVVVVEQAADRAGGEEDVAVDAEDGAAGREAEHLVARVRRPRRPLEGVVLRVGRELRDPFARGPPLPRRRVVVDDDDAAVADRVGVMDHQ